MSVLTADDVRKIATLARLDLSEEEIATFAVQMDEILGHFAALQGVDTEGVPATAHSVGGANVLRDDVPRPGLTPEEVVSGAPSAQDNMFVVPQIVET